MCVGRRQQEADSGKGAAPAPAANEMTLEQKQEQVRLNSEKAFKKLKKGELQTVSTGRMNALYNLGRRQSVPCGLPFCH